MLAGCFADVYALADDEAAQRATAEQVGRPVDLVHAALEEDGELWSGLQVDLANRIKRAGSLQAADAAIAEWAASIAGDEELASSLYRLTMRADMAGQLFVRTIEIPDVGMKVRANAARPPRRDQLLASPFDDTTRRFMERRVVSPEEFAEMSEEHRQMAFTATQLASDALRQRAQQLIAQAIEGDLSVNEFVRQMHDEEINLGVTPSSSGYLQTVFRTNVSSAYGAGRFRQLRSEAVKQARPYVMYRATMDDRTTEICTALNRRIFSQDDPSWLPFAPPNHFNCRSVIVAVRELPKGAKVTTGSQIRIRPQQGFDAPPV